MGLTYYTARQLTLQDALWEVGTYLIEHRSRRSASKANSHTLRTNIERENLRHIRNRETRPREASDKVEQEDHRDDSRARARIASLSIYGRTAGPNAERNQHTYSGDEEEFPTTDPINKLCETDGDEEGPDLQTPVYEGLVVGFRDADALEDVVEIVGSDAVAAALGKEAGENDEEKAFSVAGRLDEDAPPVLFVQLFKLDRVFDLGELGFDEVVLGVAVGVELCIDCQLGLNLYN